MNSTGKLIIIEGIDGCGGETQTKFLSEFLSKKGYTIKYLSYPEYDQPVGKIIDNYLHKNYEFNIEAKTLLYFTDFIKDKQNLQKSLENGNILIGDRYFTSTIVYQGLVEGFDVNKMIELSNIFELPKPDISIYLKISAETSIKRKMQEKGGNLDRHESNQKFLEDLVLAYDKIAKENIYCDWAVIDGEKPINEVSEDILKVINQKFAI